MPLEIRHSRDHGIKQKNRIVPYISVVAWQIQIRRFFRGDPSTRRVLVRTWPEVNEDGGFWLWASKLETFNAELVSFGNCQMTTAPSQENIPQFTMVMC